MWNWQYFMEHFFYSSHIQSKCGYIMEYSVEHYQVHVTLLWILMMLCKLHKFIWFSYGHMLSTKDDIVFMWNFIWNVGLDLAMYSRQRCNYYLFHISTLNLPFNVTYTVNRSTMTFESIATPITNIHKMWFIWKHEKLKLHGTNTV